MSQPHFIQRWLSIIALVLRILLWPLRRLVSILFPISDMDGLTLTATTKAVEHFHTTVLPRQLSPYFSRSNFTTTKQQAMQESSLLLIILHAPHSPASQEFCQDTLPKLLQDVLQESQLLLLKAWGVSIHTGQGAQLAHALNISSYPWMGVLQPTTRGTGGSGQYLNVLLRLEGVTLQTTPTQTLLQYIQQCLTRHQVLVADEMARQLHRQEEVELRRMQDEEYQETLRMDQERERRVRDEELQRQQEEASRQQELDDARELVGAEPASGGCLIRFVLPSGAKLNRRFENDTTIRAVKAFLMLYFLDQSIEMGRIGLSMSFPRKTFNEDDEQELTLVQAGLQGQAVLMVQDLDA